MKTFKTFINEAHTDVLAARDTAGRLANREAARKGGARPERLRRISNAYGNVMTKLIDQDIRDEQIEKRRSALGEEAETKKDYEGEMAHGELYNIIDNAEAICKMLKPDSQLEAWVQSKITKANDYINAVHDYLKNTPGSVG